MRIATWNLLHGQSVKPGNPTISLHQVFGNIEVDILGVQEVDENQPRSLGEKQVEEIAKAMGTTHWAYARCVTGTPGEIWRKPHPHEAVLHAHFSEPSYGIGLVSRIPVRKWHRIELGRSRVGMPLLVGSEKGVRIAYVKDEPRVALVAELENGFTVAVVHLSFVPLVNIWQLRKIQRELKKLPGKKILIGDFNLPWALPTKVSNWKSLVEKKSYPSWKPAIQFDYLLSENELDCAPINFPPMEISDHLPIGVTLK